MINFKTYPAKVVENNDPDKKGLVQIRISHLMEDTKDSLLPWARPFNNGGGGSTTQGVSFIPEKDSAIIVFFMDDFNYDQCYYIADQYYEDSNIHNKVDDLGLESKYPDVKYIKLKNGITIAMSSSTDTPEIAIHHPSSDILIDKDGNINIKAGTNELVMDDEGILIKDKNDNDITMDGSGIVIKDSNGNEIEMGATGIVLNTGDAVAFKPNTNPVCLFTGSPHSTIVKLTGK